MLERWCLNLADKKKYCIWQKAYSTMCIQAPSNFMPMFLLTADFWSSDWVWGDAGSGPASSRQVHGKRIVLFSRSLLVLSIIDGSDAAIRSNPAARPSILADMRAGSE